MATIRTATYNELAEKKVVECREKLVPVNLFDYSIEYGISYSINSAEAVVDLYNARFMVRENVALLLAQANHTLSLLRSTATLYVNCGYRSPETQHRRYLENYVEIRGGRLTPWHREPSQKITFPDVAGHPTGGAVDVTLRNKYTKEFLDMGCEIGDFSGGNCDSFSLQLASTQAKNRAVLHYCMTVQGFAPYFSKWWHFSYGDREWAVRFDKMCGKYEHVSSGEVLSIGR